MSSLLSNDIDMTEIVKAIQDEPQDPLAFLFEPRTLEFLDRSVTNCIEANLAVSEYAARKLAESIDQTFDGYQRNAMATAVFGPVDHPSVVHFLKCFEAVGKIAERAKKSFRDNKGEFSVESKETIWKAFQTVYDEAHPTLLAMNQTSRGDGCPLVYPAFGLIGEAGEVVSKLLKILEKPEYDLTDQEAEDLAFECSDLLWYLAAFTHTLGYDLGEIAKMNIEKLRSRQERNQIHGEGDTR